MDFERSSLITASFLIIALSLVGCGGGGGGDSTVTTTGSVSGTVIFSDPQPSSIMSSTGFPIAPLYRSSSLRTSAVPNEKIVHFLEGLSASDITNIVQEMGGTIKQKIYGSKNLYVISFDMLKAAGISRSSNPNIISMEDNIRFYTCDTPVTPNDEYYSTDQAWNYSMLFLPEAWGEVTTATNPVTVAVIDTGVAPEHPDLEANLTTGQDYIDGDTNPWDTSYYDDQNRYSHGTHVAGTIAAVSNNSKGVAGVCWKAPNVKIMPIRILGPDGSGSEANLISAIQFAINKSVNVINLSLASPGPVSIDDHPALKNVIIDAVDNHNITIVAAAGNENGAVGLPACYSEKVITVAALSPKGTKASYSNYGSEIFISAPGGDYIDNPSTQMILSTCYDKKTASYCYVYMQGTSMACPHIAGLAAMMYAAGINTPSAIRAKLQQYAIDKGAYGKDDYYGYGIPDVYAIFSGKAIYKKEVQVVVLNSNKVIETIQNPDSNGNYSISGLQPGSKYICVFLDSDMDGRVENGERFAYISGINVQAGVVTNVTTLTLTSISNVTSSPGPTLADYINSILP
ncbi:MAG: S8 family serine peptidase [Bacillota bacterium]